MNPLYFAGRQTGIIGAANDRDIIAAERVEHVKTGRGALSVSLQYKPHERETFEEMAKPGGYILTRGRRGAELYGIITSREAIAAGTIDIYAESVGLDLLNQVAAAYTADSAKTIAQYVALFTRLFTIRVNEVSNLTRTLEWDNDSTVAERLESIANSFGAELVYDVEIDGLEITALYIDIYKKRGHAVAKPLLIGREIRELYINSSIENLATAILATGKDGLTLSGASYDDGDIYLDVNTNVLLSRTAQAEWSQGWATVFNHEILKRYEVDTETQSILLSQAVRKLKAVKDAAISYEAEINYLPRDLQAGDTVTIMHAASGLTVGTRLIEISEDLKTGRTNAVFDEWED